VVKYKDVFTCMFFYYHSFTVECYYTFLVEKFYIDLIKSLIMYIDVYVCL